MAAHATGTASTVASAAAGAEYATEWTAAAARDVAAGKVDVWWTDHPVHDRSDRNPQCKCCYHDQAGVSGQGAGAEVPTRCHPGDGGAHLEQRARTGGDDIAAYKQQAHHHQD